MNTTANAKPARKSPTLSAEQSAYALARATFETIDATYQAIAVKVPREMGEAEAEAAWEFNDAAQDRLGYWRARDALVTAEEAMVKWSIAHAERFAAATAPERLPEIAGLYEGARIRPAIWRRMVDMAFKLAA